MKRFLTPVLSLVFSLLLFNAVAVAQTHERQGSGAEVLEERAREALRATQEIAVPIRFFGSRLFQGKFSASRLASDTNYALEDGDKILIRIFGAETTETIEQIDINGNLFIPEAGPVYVRGKPAGDLQGLVEGHLRKSFKDTVGIYVALVSQGAVGVYVTGGVKAPGRYLGSSKDDLLFFLDRAGGIEPKRGSYRNIQVRRGDRVIETFDLYDFLLHGKLPGTTLDDGDVIIVNPRGPVIYATGEVATPYAFELAGDDSVGDIIVSMAQLLPSVTNVAVRGIRHDKPATFYYSLEDFAKTRLHSEDIITFRADSIGHSIAVAIEASLDTPSLYIVPRDARLSELLAIIPIDGSSVDPGSIHLKRLSVMAEQKAALADALNRLEREILAVPAMTTNEAMIRTAEADLLSRFIARARKAEPSGIVIVQDNGHLTDVGLEDGDTVVIPDKTDIILVAGEIYVPGAFAAVSGETVKHYIERAGGFTQSAYKRRVVIHKRSGISRRVSLDERVQPGDQILVLPRVQRKYFAIAKDISQLFFQLALTTATVVRL